MIDERRDLLKKKFTVGSTDIEVARLAEIRVDLDRIEMIEMEENGYLAEMERLVGIYERETAEWLAKVNALMRSDGGGYAAVDQTD